jgi:hypothetical protein
MMKFTLFIVLFALIASVFGHEDDCEYSNICSGLNYLTCVDQRIIKILSQLNPVGYVATSSPTASIGDLLTDIGVTGSNRSFANFYARILEILSTPQNPVCDTPTP